MVRRTRIYIFYRGHMRIPRFIIVIVEFSAKNEKRKKNENFFYDKNILKCLKRQRRKNENDCLFPKRKQTNQSFFLTSKRRFRFYSDIFFGGFSSLNVILNALLPRVNFQEFQGKRDMLFIRIGRISTIFPKNKMLIFFFSHQEKFQKYCFARQKMRPFQYFFKKFLLQRHQSVGG